MQEKAVFPFLPVLPFVNIIADLLFQHHLPIPSPHPLNEINGCQDILNESNGQTSKAIMGTEFQRFTTWCMRIFISLVLIGLPLIIASALLSPVSSYLP